jgi:hypothetical protein
MARISISFVPKVSKVEVQDGEIFKGLKEYGTEKIVYMLSNKGRLIRQDQSGNEDLINSTRYTNKTGLKYHQFKLRKKATGQYNYVPVHRLLAHYFIDQDFPIEYLPEDGRVINHLDGNPSNNEISNLEITTQKGNIRHAMEVLKKQVGRPAEKVLVVNVKTGEYNIYQSTHEAMKALGMNNPGTINTYLNKNFTYKGVHRCYYFSEVVGSFLEGR